MVRSTTEAAIDLKCRTFFGQRSNHPTPPVGSQSVLVTCRLLMRHQAPRCMLLGTAESLSRCGRPSIRLATLGLSGSLVFISSRGLVSHGVKDREGCLFSVAVHWQLKSRWRKARLPEVTDWMMSCGCFREEERRFSL